MHTTLKIAILGLFGLFSGSNNLVSAQSEVTVVVVDNPTASHEVSSMPEAIRRVCSEVRRGERGRVNIRSKQPLDLNNLRINCDLQIEAESGTTPTVMSGAVILSSAPLTLSGMTFLGLVNFNALGDLHLAHNSFGGDVFLNLGTSPGNSFSKAHPLMARVAGNYAGNVNFESSNAVGTLRLNLEANASGNLEFGDITGRAFEASGQGGLVANASLTLKNSVLREIRATLRAEGSALINYEDLVDIDTLNQKVTVAGGRPNFKINKTKSANLDLTFDGGGAINVDLERLTVSGRHRIDFANAGLEYGLNFKDVIENGSFSGRLAGRATANFENVVLNGKTELNFDANLAAAKVTQANLEVNGEALFRVATVGPVEFLAGPNLGATFNQDATLEVAAGVGVNIRFGGSEYKKGARFKMLSSNSGHLIKTQELLFGRNARVAQSVDGNVFIHDLKFIDPPAISAQAAITLDLANANVPVTLERNTINAGRIGILIRYARQAISLRENVINLHESGLSPEDETGDEDQSASEASEASQFALPEIPQLPTEGLVGIAVVAPSSIVFEKNTVHLDGSGVNAFVIGGQSVNLKDNTFSVNDGNWLSVISAGGLGMPGLPGSPVLPALPGFPAMPGTPSTAVTGETTRLLLTDNRFNSPAEGLELNIAPQVKALLERNTFQNPSGVSIETLGSLAYILNNAGLAHVLVNAPTKLLGNTFVGASPSVFDSKGFLLANPAGNAGLDPEAISSPIDWNGNGCADYPPSGDFRESDGKCNNAEGSPPPTDPGW